MAVSSGRLFLVCLLLPFVGVWSLLYAGQPAKPIVDPAWLSSQLGQDDLVVVDLRSAEAFKEGHIKGAVSLPAYENLFGEGYLMPTLDELRELISAAGIGNQTRVVVYDNGDFIWAARLYWLLETMGHSRVSLLDSGFGYWPEGALPVSDEALKPKRREFVPSIDHNRLKTKLSTLMAIGEGTLIDARTEEEYQGQKSLAERYGHIPTAQNYPSCGNYTDPVEGGRMQSLETLRALYSDLDPAEPIIIYCNGGADAALNYVVLQALGFTVSVYDGSWVEWGNDPTLPIQKQSQP